MINQVRNNEEGVGHLVVVVLVVVVLAVIGFAGYEVASNHKSSPASKSSSGQSTASSSAGYASCLANYHDANLCHFEGNSLNFSKTAYTASLTLVNPQGATSTMTLASDGKGNTSLVANSDGSQISSISLGGNTYIQSGSGTTWIEYPAGSAGASSVSSNPASSMAIGVGSNGITYKAEGTTSCGSLTCYKYEVIDSSQPGTIQYAWFDTSSYKLREWQATSSSEGTVTMEVTYQAVNITAPSPVEQYGQL